MDNNKLTNTILTCVYIPLSLIGFLFLMGTDGVADKTDTLTTVCTYLVSYIGFFMFAICIGCMLAGAALYKQDRIKSSYAVRLIPLIVFALISVADLIIL